MSILSNIEPEQVHIYPFPHLVVENAIDDSICNRLIDTFPTVQHFTGMDEYSANTKIHLPASMTLNSSFLSDTWKRFLQEQLTNEAWSQIVRVFGDHFRDEYPDYESRWGKISEFQIGTRGTDDFSNCQVLLDAQLSIHTRVLANPCVDRGPHLKTREKPFEAYLLLKPDEDPAEGGDFEIYSLRSGIKPVFGPQQVTDPLYVKLEKSIPYRKNTLIMFLNTSRSIQNYSIRCASDYPLMYFNYNVSLPEKLYDIDQDANLFDDYRSIICQNKAVLKSNRQKNNPGWKKLKCWLK